MGNPARFNLPSSALYFPVIHRSKYTANSYNAVFHYHGTSDLSLCEINCRKLANNSAARPSQKQLRNNFKSERSSK